MRKANLGYSREGDTVVLRMTVDDYENLLLALGTSAGSVFKDKERFWRSIGLVNRILANNPDFTPYEVSDEKS